MYKISIKITIVLCTECFIKYTHTFYVYSIYITVLRIMIFGIFNIFEHDILKFLRLLD